MVFWLRQVQKLATPFQVLLNEAVFPPIVISRKKGS
ncbi:hypothetical protein PspLS_12039 [Pyricularia sp. CBS 133598]|nr:hypothetical protein PspLS_12039 [Pyricularia sp. CBS 133598]